MTSQLDERPAQILTSKPNGRNPRAVAGRGSRRPQRLPAWRSVPASSSPPHAPTVLGSPVGNAEHGDTPAPGVSGSGLPLHLQEFRPDKSRGGY